MIVIDSQTKLAAFGALMFVVGYVFHWLVFG